MALESVLVPYDGSEAADAMLRFACEAVTGRRRVIALYVIRVPPTLPLDPLPEMFDRDGHRALDHAEAVARHHRVSLEASLPRAREPADAIVGEACEQGVDAIFMPPGRGWLPRRMLLLSGTIRAVMRKAPCLVLGVGRSYLIPFVEGQFYLLPFGVPNGGQEASLSYQRPVANELGRSLSDDLPKCEEDLYLMLHPNGVKGQMEGSAMHETPVPPPMVRSQR